MASAAGERHTRASEYSDNSKEWQELPTLQFVELPLKQMEH